MRASGEVVVPSAVVSYDLARSFPGYASLSPVALSQMVWGIGSKLTKCEVLFLAAAISYLFMYHLLRVLRSAVEG